MAQQSACVTVLFWDKTRVLYCACVFCRCCIVLVYSLRFYHQYFHWSVSALWYSRAPVSLRRYEKYFHRKFYFNIGDPIEILSKFIIIASNSYQNPHQNLSILCQSILNGWRVGGAWPSFWRHGSPEMATEFSKKYACRNCCVFFCLSRTNLRLFCQFREMVISKL